MTKEITPRLKKTEEKATAKGGVPVVRRQAPPSGVSIISMLPPLLMVGGVVAVILVGRKMFKGIGDTVSDAKNYLTDDEQNIKGTISDKEILTASISKEQAKRMAQGLYDSMAGIFTDEERIKSIFEKFKRKADYLAVHKAFGLRPYEPLFSLDDWLSRKLSPNRNLAYWLKSEIDKKDVCYQIVKKWVTEAGFGF